jgi:hypothetical protein
MNRAYIHVFRVNFPKKFVERNFVVLFKAPAESHCCRQFFAAKKYNPPNEQHSSLETRVFFAGKWKKFFLSESKQNKVFNCWNKMQKSVAHFAKVRFSLFGNSTLSHVAFEDAIKLLIEKSSLQKLKVDTLQQFFDTFYEVWSSIQFKDVQAVIFFYIYMMKGIGLQLSKRLLWL